MRNLIGGTIGCTLGVISLWIWVGIEPYVWPQPFNSLSFLFEGSFLLGLYEFPNLMDYILIFILSWIIVGIINAIFSTSPSNTIRTSLWSGTVLFFLILAGRLLQEPSFWQDPERNFFLLEWFFRSILMSFLALISAIPTQKLIERIHEPKEVMPPPKIETICSCGAIYKSRPVLCAECGLRIEYQSTRSSDSSAQ